MFSLCYRDTPAAGPWRLSGRTFQGPAGWIELLDHPMAVGQAVVREGKLGLSILEQPHPGIARTRFSLPDLVPGADGDTWALLRTRTRRWPLHWFWIEVDGEGVTIESSRPSTVPVFLCSEGSSARAHWDPLRLSPSTFDQLGGGYRAHWRAGGRGWELIAPGPNEPADFGGLSTRGDPVRAFEALLDAATERLVGSIQRVAVGLSGGGLGSTLVCGSLARQGHDVHSFGILVPDEDAEAQRLRRAAIQRFDLVDEPCDGSFDDLCALASAAGHQVFFTDLGEKDLPRAAAMAAQALRHGLWPIHPLLDPELAQLRGERKLMRDTLARWGLPATPGPSWAPSRRSSTPSVSERGGELVGLDDSRLQQ